MKPPRISVAAIMILVLVVAGDCMVFRSLSRRTGLIGGEVTLGILGSLPMVNILTAGLALLIRRPGRLSPFRVGFLVSGALALPASRYWSDFLMIGLERALEVAGLTSLFDSDAGQALGEFGLVPAVLLIPQILIAMAGGWLARRIRVRPAVAPVVDPSPRRLAIAGLLGLVILASPAVLIEAYLRWHDDARVTRLAAGTEAVLRLESLKKHGVTFRDGSKALLGDGARVRVDRDDAPPMPGAVQIAGSRGYAVHGDLRQVRITLLDGPRAGESTSLNRIFLRTRR